MPCWKAKLPPQHFFIPIGPSVAYLHIKDDIYVKLSVDDLERVRTRRWFKHKRKPGHGGGYYIIADGYPSTSNIYLHRFLLGLAAGDKRIGDHRNGDSLNHLPHNLRIVSHRQNSLNNGQRPGKSGLRGVYPKGSKWEAMLTVDGKKWRGGVFPTKEEAYAVVLTKFSSDNPEFRRIP